MRLSLFSALFLVPVIATAQVYTWKDASGKVHYSDQPPAERNVGSRRLGSGTGDSDDVPLAAKTAAEKRQDAAKQAKEAAEKSAELEKERAEDAQRQENCSRARQNLSGIESGLIRFRMTASGEREALDGDARESELASARRAVDINCAPKPAAKK
jgi:hypothetical protein